MSSKGSLEFLTKEDIAEVMNVKETTVQSWITNGIVPHVKIGGTIRILRSDFEEAVEKNRFRGKVPTTDA